MNHKIFIAGTGGIGEAAALLLREWSGGEIELYLGDISEERLLEARSFVTQLSERTSPVKTVLMTPDEVSDERQSAFEECDVLLD